MKKPFFSLRSKTDIAKLIFAIALVGLALIVIPNEGESAAVFAGGHGNYGGSLYGLIGSLM